MQVNSCVAIIEGIFRRNGGWKRLQGELSVYYWPKIIGAEIADKTQAVCFRNGYLYIKTDNPALAHQLSLLSEDIIKKYNRKLGNGTIKGVKIKIGALDQNITFSNSMTVLESITLTESDKKLIEDCSHQISDQQLAGSFTQIMKRALSYKQWLLTEGGNLCKSCGAAIVSEFDYCPCCERKLRDETDAYLKYLRKNNKTLKFEDLQQLEEINHPVLKEYIKAKAKTEGVI